MSIIFYNNWHNGDIFVSREFIKFIVNKKINENFIYYHLNSNKLLKDIYTLKIINELFGQKKDKRLYYQDLDNVYINTWYRAGNNKYFEKYGITIFTLFEMFKEIIQKLFNETIKDELDFIPDPDYNNLIDVELINNFILKLDKKKRVLISNNDVLSGQSLNFNFNPIISKLAKNFKDVDFFITNKTDNLCLLDNVFYFEDIIPIKGCNLNEIGYFSLFCDTIIGRLSGPESFCYNFDNLTDNSKTFINFFVNDNNIYNDGSFGMTSLYSDFGSAKFIYSFDFDENSIIKIIQKELIK